MWFYLTAAILSEVVGTSCMRASDGFRRRVWIAPVLALQAVAIVFLFLCLRAGMTIGVATGIWSAIGVALTAIIAKIVFADVLTRRMGVGIGFIAVGVLLIEMGGGR